jgi:TolB-like protein/DNA-binding winged helix-turn-helix (wHTH) protein/Tfp pilus assembly protein PilF
MATPSRPTLRPVYRFASFEVDATSGELRKHGYRVPLQDQPFRILCLLLDHPAELITRAQIRETLWAADTYVDFERSLNKAMVKVRQALDDDADAPRFVQTLPRRGYRFIAAVTNGSSHQMVDIVPLSVPDGDNGSRQTVHTSEIPLVLLATESLRADAPPVHELPIKEAVPKAPRRWRNAAALAASTVILAAVTYTSWRHFSGMTPPRSQKIMLAVLPLQNLTGDPEQEYIADGLTEEMITRLGRLEPERMGVIARTSVMGYKHGSERMDQIGRELGVQYVLEGSLRRDRDHMRITAQLIQVKDQSHVWAREYDRSSKDLFALQDDVAAAVTQEVQSRLALEPRNRDTPLRPVTPEAYDSYLLGRYSLNGRTAAGLHNAEKYFTKAIEADPDYAPAYAGLADSYMLMAASGIQDVSGQARTAAKKALTIDPTLGEPHAVLALIAQNRDWNWGESEREFKLAMALNPNDATPHHWYSGGLAVRGRFDECLREIAIARQLDPLSLTIRTAEGESLYMARRYDEAISKLDRTLEIEPNFAPAHFARGLAYEQKGRWQEALADIETARRLDDTPRNAAMLGEAYALSGDKSRATHILRELQVRAKREYVSALYPAIVYAGLGEKDSAFSGLEGAFGEHATDLLALRTAALYDPLRSDPRFKDLLKRVALPE